MPHPTADLVATGYPGGIQTSLFDTLFTPPPAPSPDPEESQQTSEAILTINPFVNYRITSADDLAAPPALRLQRNLAAIRALKSIAPDLPATPEQQRALVRYAGWGSLPKVFDPSSDVEEAAHEELTALLTSEEFNSARRSTQTSFFTPPDVITGIYKLLMKLGFNGGNVLEPAAGIGHFIGLLPEDIADDTHWTAIERDPTSAAIASALYPEANVLNCSFEKSVLSNEYFDLVIGNVPFNEVAPVDPIFNAPNFSTHNYFLVRSLAALRPGGIAALITSRFTLDAEGSSVRKVLAQEADLLTAIRLPNHTFSASAGTRIVSDLLILRKREKKRKNFKDVAWLATAEIEGVPFNEFFATNPDQVVGRLCTRLGRHGLELDVVASNETNLEQAIADRTPTQLASGCFTGDPLPPPLARDNLPPEVAEVHEGGFVVVDDNLFVRTGYSLSAHGLRSTKDIRRVKSLTALRDQYDAVISTQTAEAPVTEQHEARTRLNSLYDAFKKEFGPINQEKRTVRRDDVVIIRHPNLRSFRRDPEWPKVAALENYDPETGIAKKADIFSKRVIRPDATVTSCDSIEDALAVCLDQLGRVDLSQIAQLADKPFNTIAASLAGLIYFDPSLDAWVTADEYLSGSNIRTKLADAREAAARNPAFDVNVTALEKVQPEDVPYSQIAAQLGASWIPGTDCLDFICELLSLTETERRNVEIAHNKLDAAWHVSASLENRLAVAASRTWGTDRAHAYRIIEDSLNQRTTEIYDTIVENGVDKTVRNVEETLKAQDKQQEIEARFEEWIWSNPERAHRLATTYNHLFNNIRVPTYDGSFLRLHGASATITFDPHQKNGIWQIIRSGTSLIAHEVGAGKTFLAIAAAMESKRLGLSTKTMIVVPNHMLEDWSRSFLQLYPQANILTATSSDFHSDTRRLFLARIAAGNYDAVIITQSAFTRISVSPAFESDFVAQELARYDVMLAEAKEEGADLTVKKIEKAKEQMETRLERLINRNTKDQLLNFEDLGVDQVMYDEAQAVKNLYTPTKIRGIPTASKPSQRATDMFLKARWLHQQTPGRGLVFLTATPLTNTIAEMYVMLLMTNPEALASAGMYHFDAWASVFTKRVNALELAPDGSTFRVRTRFRFTNVPELFRMFRLRTDVQTAEMLNLPRPSLAGPAETHGYHVVATPPSEALLEYIAEIVERTEKIRQRQVRPEVDNMLLVTTDGRKAALDMRLVRPGIADDPESKLNHFARRCLKIYHDTAAERATQLVFCDLSTPGSSGFSVYRDAREKLIRGYPELGIPGADPDDIAFIHDANNDIKKARLFADMRQGRKRVMFTSTAKSGTGMNVQDRLFAEHHLDCPHRPADIQQREGRILRRGNRYESVRIYRYVTERSFDAYSWQNITYKAEEISKIMTGSISDIRTIDDIGGQVLSADQVKAIATGNPKILRKAEVDQELLKLRRKRAAWNDQRIQNRVDLTRMPDLIRYKERQLAAIQEDIERRVDTHEEAFSLSLDGRTYTDRSDAGEALHKMLIQLTGASDQLTERYVGTFAGFNLIIIARSGFNPVIRLKGSHELDRRVNLYDLTTRGLIASLEALPRSLERLAADTDQRITWELAQLEELKNQSDDAFPGEELYTALTEERDRLEAELNVDKPRAMAA